MYEVEVISSNSELATAMLTALVSASHMTHLTSALCWDGRNMFPSADIWFPPLAPCDSNGYCSAESVAL